jgi:hypothetical protein
VIDGIAAPKRGNSVVKICLSSLFTRNYTAISSAISDLFRQKPKEGSEEKKSKGPILEKERKIATEQLMSILVEECPYPEKRPYTLFVIDCTPNVRKFADKLEDRSMIYVANNIGGTPVSIGHQYSVVACLPEKEKEKSSTWLYPLSVERVKSSKISTMVGMEQLARILMEKRLDGCLSVSVEDAAYSCGGCIKFAQNKMKNSIHLQRLRSNRVFYQKIEEPVEEQKKEKGRPLKYGEKVYLKNPPPADHRIVILRETKRGRRIKILIEKWDNLLIRGKEQCDPIDICRMTVVNEKDELVYPKPLWIAVVGDRRSELTLDQIYDAYTQRYDIEHFFRFGKNNLLIASFQTPDVQHEENWWWLGLVAYHMLYRVRKIAECITYPWEKRCEKQCAGVECSPSATQRDYERIISQIGSQASLPKPRGKSLGREKGQITRHRPRQLIIKKSEKSKKVAKKSTKVLKAA